MIVSFLITQGNKQLHHCLYLYLVAIPFRNSSKTQSTVRKGGLMFAQLTLDLECQLSIDIEGRGTYFEFIDYAKRAISPPLSFCVKWLSVLL